MQQIFGYTHQQLSQAIGVVKSLAEDPETI